MRKILIGVSMEDCDKAYEVLESSGIKFEKSVDGFSAFADAEAEFRLLNISLDGDEERLKFVEGLETEKLEELIEDISARFCSDDVLDYDTLDDLVVMSVNDFMEEASSNGV